MDMTYLEYCYADPYFYDTIRGASASSLGRVRRYRLQPDRDWSAWDIQRSGGWMHVGAPGAELPEQGWKIHCSATLENAQRLLEIVSDYCAAQGIPFKYLPTSADVIRSNVKYAPRGGSGKFITIYPVDAGETERILHDLDEEVGGEEGPYILSDLRYADGPLYVRYGAYKQQFVRNERDELVPALRRPDGELEPDHRMPVFSPPSWVETPAFVEAMKTSLGVSTRPDAFAYDIHEALHFSNGGGIYSATALGSGDRVVLKEARPHAGLAPDGRDAVQRLERERAFLERFRQLDQVVTPRDHFVQSGHHFLVEDLVEGLTLNKEMVTRNPLIRADQTRADRLAYRDWALAVMDDVEVAVRAFHAEGVVFGDLHPNNIIIDKEERPVFIDFEMAYTLDEDDVVAAGAPGYMAGDGRTGVPADMYSLGCMKLALFLPLTVLVPLDPPKLVQLVEQARRTFELPDSYCRAVLEHIGVDDRPAVSCLAAATREVIDAWDVSESEGVGAILGRIADGLWENADFSRADRIFPGDPRQFTENGVGIAFGACGNLLATPGDRMQSERVLDWIESATQGLTTPSFGFYDGIAGIAYTLRRFGRDTAADHLVDMLIQIDPEQLTSELYGGLSGIGLFLLEEARRAPRSELETALAKIRQVLTKRLQGPAEYIREVNGVPTAATGKAGLMHGWAGQALFWIGSYEATGDPGDLEHAVTAIDTDLSVCIEVDDGSLQVNEGWRTLPYVATGSLGIGLVLLRLRQHVQRSQDRVLLQKIVRCMGPDFAIQSNLFNGRAGFVYFLSVLAQTDDADLVEESELERHAAHLGTYAVLRKTGIHFPGEQIMRLSTDWASGSAGVHAVLERYRRVRFGTPVDTVGLPFIGLEPRDRVPDAFVTR